MGEGYDMGFQLGSALAKGVVEWKEIQLDRQQRREFDGAMGLASQRRAMIKSAASVEEAQMLDQIKSQLQRYPNAEQGERPTGGVREDGSPETEQVIRTPEGDIPMQQLLMLKQRKQQAESLAELAEVDLIMELQARYPENRYIKQWVASTYAGIQQKQQIRSKQIEAQRLQLDTMAAGLQREQFDQKLREYDEQPERETQKKATDTAFDMQKDAARIEAEKRASIEVEGVKAQNKPLKDPTEAQGKAANFGRRAQQAVGELGSIEGYDRATIQSGLASVTPNFMRSEERQRIDQAERNFVNAMLRRDSGAVIKDDEFQNYEKQFFPRAGDKPGTVAQKKRNRDLAVKALKGEAGPAWELVPEGETESAAGESDAGWTPEGIRAAYRAKKLTKDQALSMLEKLDAK